MKWDKHSRRLFLQGAGKATLALPLLPSLMPRELWGQTVAPSLRYIGITSELGYAFHADWFPKLDRPTNRVDQPGELPFYHQSLRSYAPNASSVFSPIFKNHLNPYLSSMNIYRGLDLPTRYAHGTAASFGNLGQDKPLVNPYLTELPNLRTLDQILNDNRSKFNPGGRDSVLVGFGQHSPSYMRETSGRVVMKPLDGSPTQLFNKLLAGVTPSGGGGGTQPADPLVDVLSRVIEDFNRTRNSRAISSEDKLALDSTADRISDLQKRLTPSGGGSTLAECNPANVPARFNGTASIDDFRRLFKSYVDIIVMAMSCDVSRVAMLINGLGARSVFMANWGGVSEADGFHEGISHKPTGKNLAGKPCRTVLAEYNELAVSQILVPLLQQMSAIQEPSNGQTMLHNSLIHFTQESAINHSMYCHPTLLAGNAGGRLKTGYLIDYMDRSKTAHRDYEGRMSQNPSDPLFIQCWPGLIYNRVFATILQSLGLSPQDYAHAVSADAVATQGGYGYINARSYPNSGSGYHSIRWNENQQALYNLTLSGRPLPGPTVNAA